MQPLHCIAGVIEPELGAAAGLGRWFVGNAVLLNGDRSLITSFENLERVLGIVKRHIGFQRVPARAICDLKGSCHLSKLNLIFYTSISKKRIFSSRH